MSDEAEITKSFLCKLCGQNVLVTFTPNPIISEDFIRTMLVCDGCMARRNPRFKPAVKRQASLPYLDE